MHFFFFFIFQNVFTWNALQKVRENEHNMAHERINRVKYRQTEELRRRHQNVRRNMCECVWFAGRTWHSNTIFLYIFLVFNAEHSSFNGNSFLVCVCVFFSFFFFFGQLSVLFGIVRFQTENEV